MVKDIDARDGVSIKTPGGKQRETTSLLFPRPWLDRIKTKNLPNGRTLTTKVGRIVRKQLPMIRHN